MIQPKNKREPGNPNWGGAREESKLIEKYADQWCKENGYPPQKRKYVYQKYKRFKSVLNKAKKAEMRQDLDTGVSQRLSKGFRSVAI